MDSPSSVAWGVKDSLHSPGTTGREAPVSTGSTTRTPRRSVGPGLTSNSRPARSGHGYAVTTGQVPPTVGWAERGDLRSNGHGNSVPRFHVPWAPAPELSNFANYALQAAEDGLVTFYNRHRVDELVIVDGAAQGVRGTVFAPDDSPRAWPPTANGSGDFHLTAQAVIITSGGIGGNHDIVRRYWPERMGTPPRHMITGVPAYVDGRMLDISAAAGVRLVNRDRMWALQRGHTELEPDLAGPRHQDPARPSSMWFDALGSSTSIPVPARLRHLGTLRYLRTTDDLIEHDHSWFILTQKIIEKEFALSGSEQNPDITDGGGLRS